MAHVNQHGHDLQLEDANVVKIKVIAAEDLYVDESKEFLRVSHGQSVEFRIPRTIRLLKLKKRYCEEYNLHLDGAGTSVRSGVQFKFGNRTVEDNDTCGSLCLTTNDVIKVHHTPEFHCYMHSVNHHTQRKTLQSDMRELYLDAMRSGGRGCTDVVFNLGKERIHAHKLILITRCEKLRAMFSSSFAEYNEQKTGEARASHAILFFHLHASVTIEGHDPSTFRLMLEWIYCDDVQMPSSADGCLQLLALAEEMLLFPLKTMCEVVLMNYINKQNAVTLFICSDRYHVDFLKQKCKQYIMDHYDDMLRDQPDFEKELCKVPELLVELTRSALSREEHRRDLARYVVLDSSPNSSGRGEKRRRGN